jgi:DNA polymerase III, gamma/tau subunits
MIKLIGFENQIKSLVNNYLSYNLHSSIIIHGPKGIGKKIFIKKFLSEIFKSTLNENNYLHHVNLLNKETHPNVKNIEKIFDSRSKKIKSEITIDQIRNLRNFVNETSSIMHLNKFIIIDSADDLNINSANSLLKILEEPNKDTFIFLISHQISALIPTIRSRCLKLKLNKHEYNNFNNIISFQIDNITEDEIKFLYDITNGSPR